jgi:hypothetical protein
VGTKGVHIMKKLISGVLTILTLAACQGSEPAELAPFQPGGELGLDHLATGEAIPGQYLVTLKYTGLHDGVLAGPSVVPIMERELGFTTTHVYRHVMNGFAVETSEAVAEQLAADPRVLRVVPNRVIRLSAPKRCKDNPDGPGCGGDDGGGDPPPTGQVTPWGITRVGGAQDGTGRTAWVIDTGVDLTHQELVVDAARSVSFITKGRKTSPPNDEHGHGTHVAGTMAAIDDSDGVVGVAAGATVVAVRVLDRSGSGSYAGVIAGIDHVAANAAPGDVANMSLGGGFSLEVNDAVIAAGNAGVQFSLAAGNESTDAGSRSPASANGANLYTVSAIDDTDCLASFSNYGNPPVDYAAPGVGVHSLWKDGGENTISGTSMAAPHVGGILLIGPVSADGTINCDVDGTPDPIAHL